MAKLAQKASSLLLLPDVDFPKKEEQLRGHTASRETWKVCTEGSTSGL